MKTMLEWEAAIGYYLKSKGHQVEAVICDGSSPACILREKENDDPKKWRKSCRKCKENIKKVFDKFQIKNTFYNNHFSFLDFVIVKLKIFLRQISENVIRHAEASTIRYKKSVYIENEKVILKKYIQSAIYNDYLAKKTFTNKKPNLIFMSHGIYSDWGPAKDAALNLKIPVLSYAGSYLKNHFYFGILRRKKDTVWGLKKINKNKNKSELEKKRKHLKQYLYNRYNYNDGFDLKTKFRKSRHSFKQNSRKIVSVFLHLTWDASGETFGFDFRNLLEWSEFTFFYAKLNKEIKWIFKVHPAEKWHGTGDHMYEKLKTLTLSPHIELLGPDEKISPLSLINQSRCIVTAFGTVGLEAAVLGKPVICSSGAHYAGFGFTYDWKTQTEYKKLLDNVHNLDTKNKNQLSDAIAYADEIWLKKQRKLTFLTNKDPKNYGEVCKTGKIDKEIEKENTLKIIEQAIKNKKQQLVI
jgi:hypothetical protein